MILGRLFRRSEPPEGLTAETVAPALEAAAVPISWGDALRTAVVQGAAGLVERGFVAARPVPAGVASGALGPSVRALLGRALLLTGEFVAEIRVVGAGVQLLPASSWAVTGGASPESWVYELTLGGPSGQRTVVLDGARVFHARIGASAAEPWRGRSPVESASASVRALAELERAMTAEGSRKGGQLVVAPPSSGAGSMDEVQEAMRAGRAAVVASDYHSAATGVGVGSVRIGPAVDEQSRELREALSAQVSAALGVPPVLLSGGAGASSREALRQLHSATLEPWAERVVEEARAKLDAPQDFGLDFSRLAASDLRARANALATLRAEPVGMLEDEARRLVGWA